MCLHSQCRELPDWSYCDAALLCKIAALRSYSLERLQYKRERESGMSSFAYFLARDTIDHFNTVVKPVVYLSMFYYFSNPRSTMADNYTVLLALVYCVTGIGYTLAFCFNPASGQLVCIILIIIPIPILASFMNCILWLCFAVCCDNTSYPDLVVDSPKYTSVAEKLVLHKVGTGGLHHSKC